MTQSPLTSTRDEGRVVLWDGTLAECSPLFWPIVEAIKALVDGHDEVADDAAQFPSPETINDVLGPRAGIRFERQKPVSRRRRSASRDPESMYDARIAREGCVPTRHGSWHDLMNALVWATFPLAKRALHERQHALVVPAAPGESARRPRELDALALLDEGGVVVVTKQRRELDEEALVAAIARREATAMVFGHAIYEGLVLGRPAPLASVVLCVAEDEINGADEALAAVITDPTQIVEPASMMRVRADEMLVPSARARRD